MSVGPLVHVRPLVFSLARVRSFDNGTRLHDRQNGLIRYKDHQAIGTYVTVTGVKSSMTVTLSCLKKNSNKSMSRLSLRVILYAVGKADFSSSFQ